jgi:predicted metalloprotease with PDZ domain
LHLAMRRLCICALSVTAVVFCEPTLVVAQSIPLHVDLTDAPRNIYHAHLRIPVHAGEMALVFPKWIPGNHRPSGPLGGLTGIRMEAAGHALFWERDPVEMYEFHVAVPEGVTVLDVSLDAITLQDSAGSNGPAASANILDLNWNAVLLYPKGSRSDDLTFAPSITLPPGWKFGTALEVARASGDEFEFTPVSLTTLIDSPVIAGVHYRKIELTKPGDTPVHVMDLVADEEADLAMTPKDLAAYQKLVAETGSLFGARHYRHYDFLYTLSSQVGGHGLEHHESNDSVASERTLLDPDLDMLQADLVPHEFVHSWNGKYRRPAGLATPNYQEPMVGDLLWVYEGLTDYLGNVLAARSGLLSDEQYREWLADTSAMLEHRSGRAWRSLEDTARSVQSLRMMGGQWVNWRRSLDYYPESNLIWLEVDSMIRKQTHGQRSLNDFCKRFHGGESGPPKVVPYTFADVVGTLNDIAPYDWAALLNGRVNATSTHAPLEAVEDSGWKLIYNDKPNQFGHAIEKHFKFLDFSYSLGFGIGEDGKFSDVIVGSPAYKAGLGPGMRLIAVNQRKWSPAGLHDAIKTAQGGNLPIELLVENAQFFKTYAVDYHDGEKHPHLERISDQPDILGEILKSMTP